MNLLDALRERVLIADGAMGTRLSELGFEHLPYGVANLYAPDLVRRVHEEYISAGAEVIETNTFWVNRFRLAEQQQDADTREVCLAGAKLAREAAKDAYVIGAIGPCGRPLAPLGTIATEEAREEFRIQAEALAEQGVDAFIVETFSDLDELEIAIKEVRSVADLPVIACKSFIEDGETLAEGFPLRAAQRMLEMGADVIGGNCVVGPQRMFDIIRWMAESGDAPICAMPTPGMPQLVKKQIAYDTTPEYYGKAAARLAEAGATLIGGCCGTTPEHIAEVSNSLADRSPRTRVLERTAKLIAKRPPAESEPSELSEKLGKKFVITVELDLPRGLDSSRVLEGAAALKAKGADLIDISDGARARLRMTPVAICPIIQREVGIEVMMHIACRDRNLLAIQADMLGAHALGIRNVLPITGDPTNIGDFPSATSVFDIDAIGLVRVLTRFNEGVDMAGNTVRRKCAFTIAVAFNPVAQDLETELDRLRRKVDAGAHAVYTQPLFDQSHADFAAETTCKLGVPILIGVMPLRGARHAEFMHNEVPGIMVPEWLRKRMAEAPEESAPDVGIEVAQKFAQDLPKIAQGIYLMPPFGNHKIAERVMEVVL